MRIGLISDTHIPEAGRELWPEVYRALAGADLILHAGDMHVVQVLDWLERVAPVLAARGNGDEPGSFSPLRPGVPEDARVKRAHTLELAGFAVGLVHGFPLPEEVPYRQYDALIRDTFGRDLDILVCGDTHVQMIAQYGDTLVVNPGSPTLPWNLTPRRGHVGLLEIRDGWAHAQIVNLATEDVELEQAFRREWGRSA